MSNTYDSISFSSGGYNCVYHIGCIRYIFEHPELFNQTKYIGCSGGAGIIAIILCYESDPDKFNILAQIVNHVVEMKGKNIKFTEQINHYTEFLTKFLTPEKFISHIKGSDRCNISVSDPFSFNLWKFSFRNVIKTKFDTYEQFIDTLKASACIPLLLDNQIRKIDGVSYVDGCMSDPLPRLNEHTIRIACQRSPFLKYFWNPSISPKKISTLYHAALVIPDKTYIDQMVKLGYDDIKEYVSSIIKN